jgi:hypothetical protein
MKHTNSEQYADNLGTFSHCLSLPLPERGRGREVGGYKVLLFYNLQILYG